MPRADANREGPAPLEHGIARVQGEVEERALELVRVGIGVERRLGQVEHDGDGLAQRAFEDHAHGAHQFAYLDRLRREGLRTREGEQPPDEGHAARARRQRRFEIFARGTRVAQVALEPFEVADEGGEQVVEVVREPPRELSDRLHLLRLDERVLVRLLLGDVDREHEEAHDRALPVALRHHGAAGVDRTALGVAAGVFVADGLTGVGARQRRCDLGIGVGAGDFGHGAPDDLVLFEAEPAGIDPVGEAVALVGIQIGHHRRDRVEDEPQPSFGAAQGFGGLVELTLGRAQFFVCLRERRSALGHPGFQGLVLLLDQPLVAALLGDVGPQRHESKVGDGHAAHCQDAAVGAFAFEVVRLEGARGHHPFGDQTLDVALAVFAAFGVETGEGFEGRAFMDEVFGEIEQTLHGPIPSHESGRGIEHGDRLVEQIETGEQQVEPAPIAGADKARRGRQFRRGGGTGHRAQNRGACWG